MECCKESNLNKLWSEIIQLGYNNGAVWRMNGEHHPSSDVVAHHAQSY